MTPPTQRDLRVIILNAIFSNEQRNGLLDRWSAADDAAAEILKLFPKPAKPLPAPFYPDRACDCGAARVREAGGVGKHAGWCSLNGRTSGGNGRKAG